MKKFRFLMIAFLSETGIIGSNMGKVGEYRMKRVWIAVISVLAAALIGAGAWFFLSESRQQAQI